MPDYTCSPATVWLARIAFVYLVASIYYLLSTRSIGRPFYDSLTSEQRTIKAQAVCRRKSVFLVGCLIGVLVILVWRPLIRIKKEER